MAAENWIVPRGRHPNERHTSMRGQSFNPHPAGAPVAPDAIIPTALPIHHHADARLAFASRLFAAGAPAAAPPAPRASSRYLRPTRAHLVARSDDDDDDARLEREIELRTRHEALVRAAAKEEEISALRVELLRTARRLATIEAERAGATAAVREQLDGARTKLAKVASALRKSEEGTSSLESQVCSLRGELQRLFVERQRHAAVADRSATKQGEVLQSAHAAEKTVLLQRIASLETKVDATTAEMKVAHLLAVDDAAFELESLRAAHAKELSSYQASAAQARAARTRALDEKFREEETKSAAKDVAAERTHAAALAELAAACSASGEREKALEEQLATLRLARGAENEASSRRMTELEAKLHAEAATMRATHANALDDATAELESHRKAHAKELADQTKLRLEEEKSATKHAAHAAAEEAYATTLAERAAASDEQHAALRLAHAEEVAGLEAKLLAEAAAMQATHASALDDAATELESFRTAHAKTLAGHRACAEQEQSALEAKLLALAHDASASHSSARSDAAAELSEYRAAHAAELASHQGAAGETQASLEAKLRLEKEKSAMKDAAALAELSAMRASHAEELAVSEEHLAVLRLAHAADNEASSRSFTNLEAKLHAEAAAMRATHASALDDATTDSSNSQSALSDAAEQTQAALEAKLRLEEEKSATNHAAHAAAEEAHAAALAELAAAGEAAGEREAALQETQLNHVLKHTELLELRRTHATTKKELATKISELESAHASVCTELLKSGEREAALQETHRADVSKLEELEAKRAAALAETTVKQHQRKARIKAKREALHKQIALLQSSEGALQTQLATMRATHASALDDVAAELDSQHKAHAKELADYRASAEQDQSAQKRKLLASLSSEQGDAASELSEYRTAHAAELASHQGAANQMQAALEEKLRFEEEQSAAKYAVHAAADEAHAAALHDLAALHAEELAAARGRGNALNERHDALCLAHTVELDSMSAELTDHRASAEESRRSFEANLHAQSRNRAATHASALSNAAAELKVHRAAHAVELESHRDRQASLEERHDALRLALAAEQEASALSLARFESNLQAAESSRDSLLHDLSRVADKMVSDATETRRQGLDVQRGDGHTRDAQQRLAVLHADADLKVARAELVAKDADYTRVEEAHAATLTKLAAVHAVYATELAAAGEREKALEDKNNGLHLAHDSEKEALSTSIEAKHAHELDGAAAELESYCKAHAEELANHRASAERDQSALESKLLAFSTDALSSHSSALRAAASELSEYRAAHAAELASHLAAAEQTQAALESKLRLEEEKSAAKHAAAHAAAEEANAAALTKLGGLHAAHAEALMAAGERGRVLEEKHEALRLDHAAELDDIVTELEAYRKAHANELASRDSLVRDLSSVADQMVDEAAAARHQAVHANHDEDELLSDHAQQRLAAMRARSDLEVVRAELHTAQHAQCAEAEASHATIFTLKMRQALNIVNMERDHKMQLESVTNTMNVSMEGLLSEQAEAFALMAQHEETTLAEQVGFHEQVILASSLEAAHARTLVKTQTRHALTIGELKKTLATSVAELHSEHKNALIEALREHDEEHEQTKQSHYVKLVELEAQIQAASGLQDAHAAIMANIEQKHAAEIGELNASVERLKRPSAEGSREHNDNALVALHNLEVELIARTTDFESKVASLQSQLLAGAGCDDATLGALRSELSAAEDAKRVLEHQLARANGANDAAAVLREAEPSGDLNAALEETRVADTPAGPSRESVMRAAGNAAVLEASRKEMGQLRADFELQSERAAIEAGFEHEQMNQARALSRAQHDHDAELLASTRRELESARSTASSAQAEFERMRNERNAMAADFERKSSEMSAQTRAQHNHDDELLASTRREYAEAQLERVQLERRTSDDLDAAYRQTVTSVDALELMRSQHLLEVKAVENDAQTKLNALERRNVQELEAVRASGLAIEANALEQLRHLHSEQLDHLRAASAAHEKDELAQQARAHADEVNAATQAALAVEAVALGQLKEEHTSVMVEARAGFTELQMEHRSHTTQLEEKIKQLEKRCVLQEAAIAASKLSFADHDSATKSEVAMYSERLAELQDIVVVRKKDLDQERASYVHELAILKAGQSESAMAQKEAFDQERKAHARVLAELTASYLTGREESWKLHSETLVESNASRSAAIEATNEVVADAHAAQAAAIDAERTEHSHKLKEQGRHAEKQIALLNKQLRTIEATRCDESTQFASKLKDHSRAMVEASSSRHNAVKEVRETHAKELREVGAALASTCSTLESAEAANAELVAALDSANHLHANNVHALEESLASISATAAVDVANAQAKAAAISDSMRAAHSTQLAEEKMETAERLSLLDKQLRTAEASLGELRASYALEAEASAVLVAGAAQNTLTLKAMHSEVELTHETRLTETRNEFDAALFAANARESGLKEDQAKLVRQVEALQSSIVEMAGAQLFALEELGAEMEDSYTAATEAAAATHTSQMESAKSQLIALQQLASKTMAAADKEHTLKLDAARVEFSSFEDQEAEAMAAEHAVRLKENSDSRAELIVVKEQMAEAMDITCREHTLELSAARTETAFQTQRVSETMSASNALAMEDATAKIVALEAKVSEAVAAVRVDYTLELESANALASAALEDAVAQSKALESEMTSALEESEQAYVAQIATVIEDTAATHAEQVKAIEAMHAESQAAFEASDVSNAEIVEVHNTLASRFLDTEATVAALQADVEASYTALEAAEIAHHSDAEIHASAITKLVESSKVALMEANKANVSALDAVKQELTAETKLQTSTHLELELTKQRLQFESELVARQLSALNEHEEVHARHGAEEHALKIQHRAAVRALETQHAEAKLLQAAEFAQRIANTHGTQDKATINLIAEHKSEFRDAQRETEAKLAEVIAEHSRELVDLKLEHSEAVTEVSAELEQSEEKWHVASVAAAMEHTEATEAMKVTWASLHAELGSQHHTTKLLHEAALRSASEEYKQSHGSMELEFAAAMDVVKRKYSNELMEQTRLASIALESTLSQVQDVHADALTAAEAERNAHVESRDHEHALAMSSLRSQELAARAAVLEDLRKLHDDRVDDAKRRGEEEFSALREDIHAEHRTAAQLLEQKYAAELSSTEANHDEVTGEMRKVWEAKLVEVQTSASMSMDEVRLDITRDNAAQHAAHLAESVRTLDALKMEHEEGVASLRDGHAAAVASLRDAHETNVVSLRDHHALTIEEQASTAAQRVVKLETEHSVALQRVSSEQLSIVEAAQKAHGMAIEQLHAALGSTSAMKRNQLVLARMFGTWRKGASECSASRQRLRRIVSTWMLRSTSKAAFARLRLNVFASTLVSRHNELRNEMMARHEAELAQVQYLRERERTQRLTADADAARAMRKQSEQLMAQIETHTAEELAMTQRLHERERAREREELLADAAAAHEDQAAMLLRKTRECTTLRQELDLQEAKEVDFLRNAQQAVHAKEAAVDAAQQLRKCETENAMMRQQLAGQTARLEGVIASQQEAKDSWRSTNDESSATLKLSYESKVARLTSTMDAIVASREAEIAKQVLERVETSGVGELAANLVLAAELKLRKEDSLVRIESRARITAQRNGWNVLVRNLDATRTHARGANLAQRALAGHLRRHLGSTWSRWLRYAAEQARLERACEASRARQRQRSLQRSLTGWKARAHTLSRRGALMRIVVKRRRLRATRTCWQRLISCALDERARKSATMRSAIRSALRFSSRARLTRAWRHLRGAVTARRDELLLEKWQTRILSQLRRGGVRRCWSAWTKTVTLRRRYTLLLKRARQHAASSCKSTVFHAWKERTLFVTGKRISVLSSGWRTLVSVGSARAARARGVTIALSHARRSSLQLAFRRWSVVHHRNRCRSKMVGELLRRKRIVQRARSWQTLLDQTVRLSAAAQAGRRHSTLRALVCMRSAHHRRAAWTRLSDRSEQRAGLAAIRAVRRYREKKPLRNAWRKLIVFAWSQASTTLRDSVAKCEEGHEESTRIATEQNEKALAFVLEKLKIAQDKFRSEAASQREQYSEALHEREVSAIKAVEKIRAREVTAVSAATSAEEQCTALTMQLQNSTHELAVSQSEQAERLRSLAASQQLHTVLEQSTLATAKLHKHELAVAEATASRVTEERSGAVGVLEFELQRVRTAAAVNVEQLRLEHRAALDHLARERGVIQSRAVEDAGLHAALAAALAEALETVGKQNAAAVQSLEAEWDANEELRALLTARGINVREMERERDSGADAMLALSLSSLGTLK